MSVILKSYPVQRLFWNLSKYYTTLSVSATNYFLLKPNPLSYSGRVPRTLTTRAGRISVILQTMSLCCQTSSQVELATARMFERDDDSVGCSPDPPGVSDQHTSKPESLNQEKNELMKINSCNNDQNGVKPCQIVSGDTPQKLTNTEKERISQESVRCEVTVEQKFRAGAESGSVQHVERVVEEGLKNSDIRLINREMGVDLEEEKSLVVEKSAEDVKNELKKVKDNFGGAVNKNSDQNKKEIDKQKKMEDQDNNAKSDSSSSSSSKHSSSNHGNSNHGSSNHGTKHSSSNHSNDKHNNNKHSSSQGGSKPSSGTSKHTSGGTSSDRKSETSNGTASKSSEHRSKHSSSSSTKYDSDKSSSSHSTSSSKKSSSSSSTNKSSSSSAVSDGGKPASSSSSSHSSKHPNDEKSSRSSASGKAKEGESKEVKTESSEVKELKRKLSDSSSLFAPDAVLKSPTALQAKRARLLDLVKERSKNEPENNTESTSNESQKSSDKPGTSGMGCKMPSNVHPDLYESYQIACEPAGLMCTSKPLREAESAEYGAYDFTLNKKNIKFRTAKITPTKVGAFVTLWKRQNGKGPIMPIDIQDPVDLFVVCVRDGKNFGQFVFPKQILLVEGVLSKGGKGGKRAIRVYPPWVKTDSPQAIKSQDWQVRYFVNLTDKSGKVNLDLVKRLYSK